jgi:dsRNA-specific ribonuclease
LPRAGFVPLMRTSAVKRGKGASKRAAEQAAATALLAREGVRRDTDE